MGRSRLSGGRKRSRKLTRTSNKGANFPKVGAFFQQLSSRIWLVPGGGGRGEGIEAGFFAGLDGRIE
jgi:hypothetical protein